MIAHESNIGVSHAITKDFDIYKKKQGVKSLHDCCGVEFLTLLEGAMNVTIPDADDGDDPLRALF